MALPSQRRTPALQRHLEAVSFALGGQAGRRLARRLQLGASGTSRNTLLRLIRRAHLPSASERAPHLRLLGVDDFAFRRGLRYGALLVDLEQHRVIDLLPDREAATLAAWLTAHGSAQIEVVSRDRGGAFADGVRQGAPQAVQVADRFHLVRNLGQALDRLLTREQRVLTRVAEAISASRRTGETVRSPPTRLNKRLRLLHPAHGWNANAPQSTPVARRGTSASSRWRRQGIRTGKWPDALG